MPRSCEGRACRERRGEAGGEDGKEAPRLLPRYEDRLRESRSSMSSGTSREPPYKYITVPFPSPILPCPTRAVYKVREPVERLRERAAQAADAGSSHYYSTISEHSYEALPAPTAQPTNGTHSLLITLRGEDEGCLRGRARDAAGDRDEWRR